MAQHPKDLSPKEHSRILTTLKNEKQTKAANELKLLFLKSQSSQRSLERMRANTQPGTSSPRKESENDNQKKEETVTINPILSMSARPPIPALKIEGRDRGDEDGYSKKKKSVPLYHSGSADKINLQMREYKSATASVEILDNWTRKDHLEAGEGKVFKEKMREFIEKESRKSDSMEEDDDDDDDIYSASGGKKGGSGRGGGKKERKNGSRAKNRSTSLERKSRRPSPRSLRIRFLDAPAILFARELTLSEFAIYNDINPRGKCTLLSLLSSANYFYLFIFTRIHFEVTQ